MESRDNNWLAKLTENAYRSVVAYVFFLIVAALLFLAAFSTSFIDSSERIYFLPDSLWLNLVSFSVAMVVALIISGGRFSAFARKLEEDDRLCLRPGCFPGQSDHPGRKPGGTALGLKECCRGSGRQGSRSGRDPGTDQYPL